MVKVSDFKVSILLLRRKYLILLFVCNIFFLNIASKLIHNAWHKINCFLNERDLYIYTLLYFINIYLSYIQYKINLSYTNSYYKIYYINF